MKIAIWLSTKGGSPLQVGIERGLAELGHRVEPYRAGAGYDLVVAFNQCAHTTDYEYPAEFPDASTPVAFVDSAEYGWTKRTFEPLSAYWNAFASGAMAHDTKNREQQERLRGFLAGRSFPYFAREFWNAYDFPPAYHPIDYPLYALSVCHRRPERRRYLSRSVDVACLWGLSNPFRVPLTAEVEASPFRKDVYVIERDGPRLPQHGAGGYFARLEAARASISFDGYGSGSFRMTEVLVRTLLLQGPLAIRTRAPLIHGETCYSFCVWADGERYVRSDLVERLREILDDPERAFRIYARGYDHCMTYLTERATAEYLLNVVASHDWTRETAL